VPSHFFASFVWQFDAQMGLQTPFWHVSSRSHSFPQEPQLYSSVLIVLHVLSLHFCWPVGQTQTLSLHVMPLGHVVPVHAVHAVGHGPPQSMPHSLASLTPFAHVFVVWQTPPLQTPLHALPHSPQFLASLNVLTHFVPHASSGGMQR
jgi:hypothetical protein